MLLAGDIGGTKTLVGLFDPGHRRPKPIAVHSYRTASFESFIEILDAFARDVQQPLSPTAVAIGVAGPVVAQRATLTNVHWGVSADQIRERLGTVRVALLNDLESLAQSVELLTDAEVAVLQEGLPRSDGNAAVIAAGTGLGEAYLHRVGTRFHAMASEGGHADFAARTDREMELVMMLRDLYGRAEIEQVVSGRGLVNLHRFTHAERQCPMIDDPSDESMPARLTEGGITGRCLYCAEALEIFVEAYGAQAGNLALRAVAMAGVYVGGGIAPKILPALQDGRFMNAFRAKPPLSDLVARIPVKVIVTPDATLLGAAAHALELSS